MTSKAVRLAVSFLLACSILPSRSSAAPAAGDEKPAVPGVESLGVDSLDGRVVLVDFWASWCVPCRKSFPWLQSLLEKRAAEGLVVVAVNVDKDRAAADTFLAKYPGKMRIVYDREGRLAKQYGLKGMPSSFLYDRKGVLRETRLGFYEKDTEKIEAMISALLAEKAEDRK